MTFIFKFIITIQSVLGMMIVFGENANSLLSIFYFLIY